MTLGKREFIGGLVVAIVVVIVFILFMNFRHKDVYYQVIFDSDGGTEVAGQNILIGSQVKTPSETTKDGYIFKGWFLGDKEFDFSVNVREDIVLKAKWEKISTNDVIDNSSSNNTEKKSDDQKNNDSSKKVDEQVTPNVPKSNIIGVTGISLSSNSVSLKVGETTQINATIEPSNATNKNVTWSTSDAGVATVSGGVIRAVGAGSAVITATSGGVSVTCSVNVTKVVTYTYELIDIPSSSIGQCYLYIKNSDGEHVSGVVTIHYTNGTSETIEVSSTGVIKVRSIISSVSVVSVG